jgi:hypothetical protein
LQFQVLIFPLQVLHGLAHFSSESGSHLGIKFLDNLLETTFVIETYIVCIQPIHHYLWVHHLLLPSDVGMLLPILWLAGF